MPYTGYCLHLEWLQAVALQARTLPCRRCCCFPCCRCLCCRRAASDVIPPLLHCRGARAAGERSAMPGARAAGRSAPVDRPDGASVAVTPVDRRNHVRRRRHRRDATTVPLRSGRAGVWAHHLGRIAPRRPCHGVAPWWSWGCAVGRAMAFVGSWGAVPCRAGGRAVAAVSWRL